MTHRPFHAICRRLRDNVRAGQPDRCDSVMQVAALNYRDPVQWARELDAIFLEVPLLVALSCDLPERGDFRTFVIAGRALLIVRGDDGRVRTFINACRHRGARVAGDAQGHARRFTCPYHAWSYDLQGRLDGVAGRESFGDIPADALQQLPTEERLGAVFAVLRPDAVLDLDDWLAHGMGDSLRALELDALYAHRATSVLETPNWKLAADGYLDGYHIGYLHRDSIGAKAITNRNTYDLLGPHARIGFANKRIEEIDALPEAQWQLPDYMSLVHYVFPNVSISGGIGDTLMLSRLFPGPSVDRSITVQHQYFRQPIEGDLLRVADEKLRTYERVVRDEDAATIFGIGESLPGMAAQPILFGRNEPANQHLHRTIAAMTQSHAKLGHGAPTGN